MSAPKRLLDEQQMSQDKLLSKVGKTSGLHLKNVISAWETQGEARMQQIRWVDDSEPYDEAKEEKDSDDEGDDEDSNSDEDGKDGKDGEDGEDGEDVSSSSLDDC